MSTFEQMLFALVTEPDRQLNLSLVAAHALVAGLDSLALREAAGQPLRDDRGTRLLFLQAARELGYPVPDAEASIGERQDAGVWLLKTAGPTGTEDGTHAVISAHLARLQRAVEVVRQDLASTLAGPPALHVFVYSAEHHSYLFTAYVADTHGAYVNEDLIGSDTRTALYSVAEAVQAYMMDLKGVVWPVCPHHRRGLHVRARDTEPAQTRARASTTDTVTWWCSMGPGRDVVEIGQLTERI